MSDGAAPGHAAGGRAGDRLGRAVGGWLRSLPARSAQGPTTGRRPSFAAPALVLVVFAILPVFSASSFQLSRYELVLTYMMVVIGLNFCFGFAGQLMIGQPVLMGVAAYTAGLLNLDQNWNAWETLLPALAVAFVLGIVLYLPGFRLRGWYLAITTFFAVLVFPTVIVGAGNFTGGTNGEGPIALFPGFVGSNPTAQFEFVLLLTVICWLGVRGLVYSRFGRMMKTMRDSPDAARSAGINTTFLGLAVAGLASLPVGLAGWTFAHTTQEIAPISFGFNLLLLLMAAVMLGGRGTLWGPVLGTIVFELFSLYVEPFGTVNSTILGFGVFVSATAFPIGVVPVVREWFRVRAARAGGGGRRLTDTLGTATDDAGALVEAVELPRVSTRAGGAGDGSAGDGGAGDGGAGDGGGTPVLRATGIRKAFGGNRVLHDVDLDLYPGLVHGLVGPNGSGKTTLLNVVSGFVRPDQGRITLRGEPIEQARPYEIARLGIRRSFQVPQLVPELSVAENIKVGLSAVHRHAGGAAGSRRLSKADVDARVAAAAAALGLTARHLDLPVKELSLGLRRIVEIGRAMVAGPAVLCLDEPAAGLAEEDITVVERTLREIAASDCSVLLIEHNLSFVRRVADIVVELEDGEVLAVKDLRPGRRVGASAHAGVPRPAAVAGSEAMGTP